jgi:alkanesulfonate monooxygenase SsuD/methylene tetrahydromethanopterin reductase-like flavin-dependent oxidoreductase (luciferase family)
VGADAASVESPGYDGLMVKDIKQNPLVVMALAAQATLRIRLGTAVANALPRSPLVMAMTAWTPAKLTRGRCTLGLGTQVKGHIERRFGLQWSAPGRWIRVYMQALRMHRDAWQHVTRLDSAGPPYRINL